MPRPSAKDQLAAIVADLPADSTYDDLLRELAFNRMIERGVADAESGRTLSTDALWQQIRSWPA